MPAADVGDERAGLELVAHAVERRHPRVDEVGVVAGAEEALAADVHVGVVLVPAVARAATGGVDDVTACRARVPSAIWKKPGRNAGLSGSVSARACSGGRV